ncbi:hypothetical protein [Nocardia cyriacigeorgica]|uniref:hypothetical protein n=1 Tax=Nocardia cyriacigeorgica TaxID=135487 RepID=UPI001E29D2CC|nr:hypothetical protein [Nocardia cyriacigeorgica]
MHSFLARCSGIVVARSSADRRIRAVECGAGLMRYRSENTCGAFEVGEECALHPGERLAEELLPGFAVADSGNGFAAQVGVGYAGDSGVVDEDGAVELGDIEGVRDPVLLDDEDRTVPGVVGVDQAVDFTVETLGKRVIGVDDFGETGGEAVDEAVPALRVLVRDECIVESIGPRGANGGGSASDDVIGQGFGRILRSGTQESARRGVADGSGGACRAAAVRDGDITGRGRRVVFDRMLDGGLAIGEDDAADRDRTLGDHQLRAAAAFSVHILFVGSPFR